MTQILTGTELISIERAEQYKKHGRTVAHDLKFNNKEQLAIGAAFLCFPDIHEYAKEYNNYNCPKGWDINIWNRMYKKPYKERLIIAGALIAAEIDRLTALEK